MCPICPNAEFPSFEAVSGEDFGKIRVLDPPEDDGMVNFSPRPVLSLVSKVEAILGESFFSFSKFILLVSLLHAARSVRLFSVSYRNLDREVAVTGRHPGDRWSSEYQAIG